MYTVVSIFFFYSVQPVDHAESGSECTAWAAACSPRRPRCPPQGVRHGGETAEVPPTPPPKPAAAGMLMPEEGPEEPLPATPTTPEDALSSRAKRALRGSNLADYAVQTPV